MSAVPGQPPQPPQRQPASTAPVPPQGVPPTAPIPPGAVAPAGTGEIPPQYVAKTPWTAYIKPVLWTLVALYVIAFVFLNRETVTINFVFFQASVALIFVLVGLALIGAGLCAGVMVMTRRRANKKAELAAAQAAATPGKKK